jgi:hypothetical protein
MKRSNSALLVFILLGTLGFLPTHDFTKGLTYDDQNLTSVLNDVNDAFDQIYGNPGYTALAISEEDNLIFTNSYKGLALFQLDDLLNSSHYGIEIGLSEATIFDIEIDKDLKLLYISTIGSVDILNYSVFPLQATNIATGNFGVFDLTKNVVVDHDTNIAWISSNDGVSAYDPIKGAFLDTSGYPVPSSGIITLDISDNYLFIGAEDGFYWIDMLTNTSQKYTTTDGLPYNEVSLVKYYPTENRTFITTKDPTPNTGLAGGLTVIFENETVETYNLTEVGYNPLPIIDIAFDSSRELGYIASFISANTECGLYIFNASSIEGVARSAQGTGGSSSIPYITADYSVEGLLASVEINELTNEAILGSIQRLQILTFVDPLTPASNTVWSGPILGMYHNMASDVHYDPIDETVYVSTLLGLNRFSIYSANEDNLEYLLNVPGAGGNTAGELLVNSRLMFHHRYLYNISNDGVTDMSTILPLDEYNHIRDISSSPNESVIYYSVGRDENGNGSLIIYNWQTGNYSVHDLGYDRTDLELNEVLHDPTREVLYIATNKSLVMFNLTTREVIKTFGEVEEWDIRSLTWIDGKIWVGLEQSPHVKIFDPITETFEDFTQAALWIPTINDIVHISETNEIMFTSNRGIYLYNMTNEEIKFEGESEGLSSLFVARADYSPITGKMYIGTYLGLNVYDLNFDDKLPEIEIDQFVYVSGNFAFETSGKDYSGIKNITVELWNSTWRAIWVAMSEVVLSINVDTTQYDNGDYTLTVYVTDWNGLMNTTSQSIEIDNVVVGEYSALTALILFPVIACIVYISKRKR